MLDPWDWGAVPRPEVRSPLRVARIHAYLTQQELADRVGVSRRTIWSLEHERSTPSVSLAQALGLALAKPLDELFPPS